MAKLIYKNRNTRFSKITRPFKNPSNLWLVIIIQSIVIATLIIVKF